MPKYAMSSTTARPFKNLPSSGTCAHVQGIVMPITGTLTETKGFNHPLLETLCSNVAVEQPDHMTIEYNERTRVYIFTPGLHCIDVTTGTPQWLSNSWSSNGAGSRKNCRHSLLVFVIHCNTTQHSQKHCWSAVPHVMPHHVEVQDLLRVCVQADQGRVVRVQQNQLMAPSYKPVCLQANPVDAMSLVGGPARSHIHLDKIALIPVQSRTGVANVVITTVLVC